MWYHDIVAHSRTNECELKPQQPSWLWFSTLVSASALALSPDQQNDMVWHCDAKCIRDHSTGTDTNNDDDNEKGMMPCNHIPHISDTDSHLHMNTNVYRSASSISVSCIVHSLSHHNCHRCIPSPLTVAYRCRCHCRCHSSS